MTTTRAGKPGDWKRTPIGRVAKFIGSIRFAIPVLVLTVGAMVWGTWLESTQNRKVAGEIVYGAWWFELLMVAICAALVLSVVVRYPWKPKHTGFIIVHASLISLIIVSFFTMNTKIEARMILEEGDRARIGIMEDRWVQLVEPDQFGGHRRLASTEVYKEGWAMIVPSVGAGSDRIVGQPIRFEILEFWDNSQESFEIRNDGPSLLHAVEVATGVDAWNATEGEWMPQIASGDAAMPVATGEFAVRAVAQGRVWTPPTEIPAPVLTDSLGNIYHIGQPGDQVGQTGWTVAGVQSFKHATIGETSLVERGGGVSNWAMQLELHHQDGSIEQHVAFEKLREVPLKNQRAGATTSDLSLTYAGPSFTEPTLAIMRDTNGTVSALYADLQGNTERFTHDGAWPWRLEVAGSPVAILNSYERGTTVTVLEQIPPQESSSPVAVIATDQGATNLVWNTPTEVTIDGRDVTLAYGPVEVPLPFVLELTDFRKIDYPGVDNAMAYESDVNVTDLTADAADAEPFPFKIHMNHPYKQDGWKVYQAAFLSDSVTVFQLTYDPGLIPTYVACTTLCLGIILIFYSRRLSMGHPGIPAPFGKPGARAVRPVPKPGQHAPQIPTEGGNQAPPSPVEQTVQKADEQPAARPTEGDTGNVTVVRGVGTLETPARD